MSDNNEYSYSGGLGPEPLFGLVILTEDFYWYHFTRPTQFSIHNHQTMRYQTTYAAVTAYRRH